MIKCKSCGKYSNIPRAMICTRCGAALRCDPVKEVLPDWDLDAWNFEETTPDLDWSKVSGYAGALL